MKIAGLAILLATALVIALLIVYSIVLRATGMEADVDLKAGKFHLFRPTRDDPRLAKLRVAMEMQNDLAQGIVALIEAADVPDANVRAKAWFERFCSSLGHSLTHGAKETYRVTLWLDDPEENVLRALGHHLTTREELPRSDGTVGGYVVRTGDEYYAPDCRHDPIYRSPKGRRRGYNCVLGVPLGAAEEVWGAITVDAKKVDGFTDTDKEIVRNFAGLASAAGAAWAQERAEQIDTDER